MTGIPRGRIFVLLPRLGIYTRRNGCGRRSWLLNRWMAFHLASGVDQVSPSTPGVRLPSFSDTRLTANTLAENELTRNRCRAFTLRQSCSRVALAIRVCSLLTRRCMSGQTIWLHSFVSREAAE